MTWVFTAPWDPRSAAALVESVPTGSTVITGWIALDSAGGLPVRLFDDPVRRDSTRDFVRYALVTSYRGERFHPEAVRTLAADPAARTRAADVVERLVAEGAYRGVVLDLEALTADDTASLAVVANALATAARRGGARDVAIAVPALDTAAYPPRVLLPHVDRLLVMLYDLHWSGSVPGPVVARPWARQALAAWVAAAGPNRVVAALPTYGYHWRAGTPTDVVGWADVQRLAKDAGKPIVRDSVSGALRLTLGAQNEAWIADAPLAAQLAHDARTLGVRTIALWRLGLEDPAVWTALGTR